MLFLRSSSFAAPLLLDKSAFYLIVNHYHSEGRREAEGKQNELTAYSLPSGILPLLQAFLPVWHCAAKVMGQWHETRAEKVQFGNLLKIAAFCGVQQWRLQSRDGRDGNFAIGSCAREKLSTGTYFIGVETLLCGGRCRWRRLQIAHESNKIV